MQETILQNAGSTYMFILASILLDLNGISDIPTLPRFGDQQVILPSLLGR